MNKDPNRIGAWEAVGPVVAQVGKLIAPQAVAILNVVKRGKKGKGKK